MKEKILALLTAKFAQARKDGLNQLATSLALTATTDEEATATVDKLTEQSVGQFITDWRKEADSEISKANKTYENGLKEKYNFVEKSTPTPPTPPTTLTPEAIATIVQKAIEPFATELNTIKASKTIETRKQLLAKELEVLDEGFRTPYLSAFDRMNFKDDDDFNSHLTSVKAEVAKFQQSLIDKGLGQQSPPMFGNKGGSEEDNFVEQMKTINSEPKKEN